MDNEKELTINEIIELVAKINYRISFVDSDFGVFPGFTLNIFPSKVLISEKLDLYIEIRLFDQVIWVSETMRQTEEAIRDSMHYAIDSAASDFQDIVRENIFDSDESEDTEEPGYLVTESNDE